jgi:hypothetical protein
MNPLYKLAAIALLVLGIVGGIGYAVVHYGDKREAQGEAKVKAAWEKKDREDEAMRAADARQQIKFNDAEAGQHAAKLASLNDQLGAANAKIARLSGRPCLSAGTVGVLNSTGVLDSATAPVEPASSPQAAASSADDGATATDQDVAGYIALCRTRYAEVADQLNKILDIEDRRYPPAK